jgi:hypothetical protein
MCQWLGPCMASQPTPAMRATNNQIKTLTSWPLEPSPSDTNDLYFVCPLSEEGLSEPDDFSLRLTWV